KREGPVPLRIQRPEKQKHTEDKSEIADAVDDERLVSGARVVLILIPETNQRVGAQPGALPTHEHEQKVVSHDEREHGRHEKIQVSEEAPERLVIVHVAGG